MKKLLFSRELEYTLINTLVLDNSKINSIITFLNKEDFYDITCSKIYDIMVDMTIKNEQFDSITFKNLFGPDYINILTSGEDYTINVYDCANKIKTYAKKRGIKQMADRISREIDTFTYEDITELLSTSIEQLGISQDLIYSPTEQTKLYDDFLEKLSNPNYFVKTGFKKYDKYYSAFFPGQLIIVGARASVGKTSFALTLAKNMMKLGKRVGFFSLEMKETEILTRLICMEYSLSTENIYNRDKYTMQCIKEFTDKFKTENRFFIDVNTRHNEISISNNLRYMKKMYNIEIAIIDYIGLMKAKSKTEKKTYEIAEITSMLKDTAKKLEIPVVCLAQLNRDAANQKNAPGLHNLRDSGSLEQDADTVLLLHREDDTNTDESVITKLIIAKQRNGKTGIIDLIFQKQSMEFREKLTQREEDELSMVEKTYQDGYKQKYYEEPNW